MYAANPNLIYMQTTAMGEALYLALFIWVVVYFSEFVRGDAKALTKCGLCLGRGLPDALRRMVSGCSGGFRGGIALSVHGQSAQQSSSGLKVPQPPLAKFLLLATAAPALWLAYNGIVYRNPLEFANGPYSAKAIERRTQNAGNPGHPGTGNLLLAGMYFLKSAEANMADNEWLQRTWVLLATRSGRSWHSRFR